jgi:signal transduction histidine kinase
MLDDLGLLPALLWHVQRFTAQSGIRIAFSHEGLNRRFSAKIETAAYRIIQETLTNVARHAGVGEAAVRVWTEHDRLHVRVEDTGSGFDTEQALASYASSGLLGMKERASLLGGRFAVDSAVGAGTHVLVELPITDPSTLEGESP